MIIKEVASQVLAKCLVTGGDFAEIFEEDSTLAAKGFYIESGKKSYSVEQITIVGNYFNMLKDIEEVGNDLKFPMSSIGSPSVKIKEILLAGK